MGTSARQRAAMFSAWRGPCSLTYYVARFMPARRHTMAGVGVLADVGRTCTRSTDQRRVGAHGVDHFTEGKHVYSPRPPRPMRTGLVGAGAGTASGFNFRVFAGSTASPERAVPCRGVAAGRLRRPRRNLVERSRAGIDGRNGHHSGLCVGQAELRSLFPLPACRDAS